MMHYQVDHWAPIRVPPTLGMIRLRYAAGASMLAFFISALLAIFLSFAAMLPFIVASLICWVVLGSASRKNRKSIGRASIGRIN